MPEQYSQSKKIGELIKLGLVFAIIGGLMFLIALGGIKQLGGGSRNWPTVTVRYERSPECMNRKVTHYSKYGKRESMEKQCRFDGTYKYKGKVYETYGYFSAKKQRHSEKRHVDPKNPEFTLAQTDDTVLWLCAVFGGLMGGIGVILLILGAVSSRRRRQ